MPAKRKPIKRRRKKDVETDELSVGVANDLVLLVTSDDAVGLTPDLARALAAKLVQCAEEIERFDTKVVN